MSAKGKRTAVTSQEECRILRNALRQATRGWKGLWYAFDNGDPDPAPEELDSKWRRFQALVRWSERRERRRR